MPVFQVSSRTTQLATPPKKKPQRLRQEWIAVIRFIVAVNGAGGLFALLVLFIHSNDTLFILLPVFLSLALGQFQRYNLKLPVFVLNILFNSTPIYLLLTGCWAFIYYGMLTALELLIHLATVSHIVFITTAFAWAIIGEPVRVYVQKHIEQRFNVRDREADKAIEAFTTTLREEINLDQLRERFLTVIQRNLQPYSISLWMRTSHSQQEQSDSAEEIIVADDDPLISYILHHPSALELDRLQLDSPVLQELKLHMADILLPLASQGELIGLLILGPHLKGQAYTHEERTMLDILAPQVAPALRVAQLVQEQQQQVRERERIEQELRTAQAIQHAFLPEALPLLAGWQLATYYQPAREVGGDFYDFIPFDDGRLGLVIGDATDKGMPAALVMTTTSTMLRTVAQAIVSPAEALARVNDLLYSRIPSRMFVTCFYAILDPKSGQLHYANAGHELPYLRHDGSATELRATGMPLGMLPGSKYEEHEATIAAGESLLFYSDGLVEAHNSKREMFDTPRLQKLLEARADGSSLIDVVLADLKRFTGEGWEQEDDVTLVTLQRTTEL